MKRSKPRRGQFAPRPREPLTRKALAAIERYVSIKANGTPIMYFGIRWTLEAEKMPRAQLYEWLEARGWRWKAGRWEQKEDNR
jgi:hypothetical protein